MMNTQSQAFQAMLKRLEQEADKYVAELAGETQEQNSSEAKSFTEDEWQNFAKEMGLQGGHCDIGSSNDVDDFFKRLSGRW
jgi:hypothetical protein